MFSSYSDIEAQLKEIAKPSSDSATSIAASWNTRLKPVGSLGRLEEIAIQVGAAQSSESPRVDKPALRLFAGSHGIVEEGVSSVPPQVNQQMVQVFAQGGAAINALCRSNFIDFKAYDLGVDRPTKSFLKEPAMSSDEVIEAFNIGWNSVPQFCNLFAVGEMGIGNTTPSAAIISTVTNTPIDTIVGRGAGLSDEQLDRKTNVLKTALNNRKAELNSPLEILASIGGREIVAMTAAILSAANKKIPVVLDGVISGAAASIAFELQPNTIGYCLAGHCSAEPAHRAFVDHYKLAPILDLGMRLGEGTGAAVAMGIVRNAIECFQNMASFADVGISLE